MRLTDAELAAELYRAMWTAERAKRKTHEMIQLVYGNCREVELRKDQRAKVEAIERFATCPSYDE